MEPFYQFEVHLRNKKTGKWEFFSYIEGDWEEIKNAVDGYLEEYKTDVTISNGWQHRTYTYGEDND